MMLRHIGKSAEANKLEKAVAAVIAEGKNVTYDMKADPGDLTAVGTSEMADAIIEKIKSE
jgi:isocitrate dehydrogenase (NAD+)